MASPAQPQPQPDSSSSLLDVGSIAAAIQSLGGSTTNFIGLQPRTDLAGPSLEQSVVQNVAPTDIAPRYMSGAEYMPVQGNATPDEIFQLQTQMAQAGLLTGNFIKGWWDDNSRQAFNTLLANANNAGTDYQTMLARLQNTDVMTIDPTTGQPVVKRKGVKALSLSITNPDDIATTAQNTAQQFLGRPLSDAELQRFTSIWQSQEKGYQTAAQQNQVVGGTAVRSPSDMTAEAARFEEGLDPTAYRGQQAIGLVNHLNGMLDGLAGVGQPKVADTAAQLGVAQ